MARKIQLMPSSAGGKSAEAAPAYMIRCISKDSWEIEGGGELSVITHDGGVWYVAVFPAGDLGADAVDNQSFYRFPDALAYVVPLTVQRSEKKQRGKRRSA